MSRMIKALVLSTMVVGCSSDEPSDKLPPPWGVPISGGNLLVSREGNVVVADPDRDRVLMVDLKNQAVLAEVALPNDEPGRLVEDSQGRIHVAMRRGGALVTFASAHDGTIVYRRPVCAEPRGVAYDSATDLVHVACTGGDLVSFASSGGDAVRRVRLDRDLRDVVVTNGSLLVSRFRSAELLTIAANGTVAARATPPVVQRFGGNALVPAVPTVAWRTIALPNGRTLVAHQRQVKSELKTETGGYGSSCGGGGPVETALSVLEPGLPPQAVSTFNSGALPVDVAVSPTGSWVAIATAGDGMVQASPIGVLANRDMDQCKPLGPPGRPGTPTTGGGDHLGAPTSIGFTAQDELVIFYPEVPALVVRSVSGVQTSKIMTLPGELGYDAGRSMFHAQTSIGLACASCHPEGREDGLVWEFAGFGRRRTQSLAGGILARAPYHWVGDMTTLDVLMDDVFANRMLGGKVTSSQRASLGPWLDRVQPAAAVPVDDALAIERGRDVFESAQCGACHSGPLLTNNQLVDVGTGGTFKVPSLLGIAARAPFMHSGCAPTLRDRFGACGGGDRHGLTSGLSQAQLNDLIAYLESL